MKVTQLFENYLIFFLCYQIKLVAYYRSAIFDPNCPTMTKVVKFYLLNTLGCTLRYQMNPLAKSFLSPDNCPMGLSKLVWRRCASCECVTGDSHRR